MARPAGVPPHTRPCPPPPKKKHQACSPTGSPSPSPSRRCPSHPRAWRPPASACPTCCWQRQAAPAARWIRCSCALRGPRWPSRRCVVGAADRHGSSARLMAEAPAAHSQRPRCSRTWAAPASPACCQHAAAHSPIMLWGARACACPHNTVHAPTNGNAGRRVQHLRGRRQQAAGLQHLPAVAAGRVREIQPVPAGLCTGGCWLLRQRQRQGSVHPWRRAAAPSRPQLWQFRAHANQAHPWGPPGLPQSPWPAAAGRQQLLRQARPAARQLLASPRDTLQPTPPPPHAHAGLLCLDADRVGALPSGGRRIAGGGHCHSVQRHGATGRHPRCPARAHADAPPEERRGLGVHRLHRTVRADG